MLYNIDNNKKCVSRIHNGRFDINITLLFNKLHYLLFK